MSQILVFTRPSKGHLYPLVPVLGELSARGHRITAETLPGSQNVLNPLGITVRELPESLTRDDLDDGAQSSPQAALSAAMHALVRHIPDEITAIEAAVDAVRPDALIVDMTSIGAQIYAAASGLPWASWSPMLLPIPSRCVPPFGPGLTPMRGPLGRIRDAVVQTKMDRLWDEVLPQINAARLDHRLPPLRHTFDYLAQPPLMLNFTAQPFDDPRDDWPTEVQQIGPGLWAPPATRPAWLDEIDRPLAIVTCSTEFQDDGALAQIAMDALSDSGMYTVVTAGAVDPSSFSVPANARVEAFLPHHLLLDRTAVVVSHGGMGITQKALAAGVPVCVVPFGRDQREVARRVVTNKAGVWVPKKKLTVTGLRAGIERAQRCAPGARRVAAGFAAAGGPTRGADLLEYHFAGRLRTHRQPEPESRSVPDRNVA
ncbi:glycosyltransferase [Nocardia arthritidis]|uniref:Glycosyltransferase n=1 Tax=Nocardia arthritidis TaxID=228602 RepID=A0A6G9YME3_9NOCA|nr:nucleotide disphospho-sugar-binding domain-containing protein [Nocardia arthritidis]QIS14093.1 glycosyltransferase [Nocardia arthritidis]